MRRCLILLAAASRAVAINDAHINSLRTRFTFCRPTDENLLRILLGGDALLDYDAVIHSLSKKVKFNHNSVGVTCPTISKKHNHNHDVFPLCQGYPMDNEDELNIFQDQLANSSRNATDKNILCSSINYRGWRILRFYKRVGSGKECYKRVQNEIYNWNFVSCNGKKEMGILAPNTMKSVHLVDFKQSQCTSFPRRGLLGTFSETSFINNSIFVTNPIHVIYDIKDSRKIVPNCIVSASSYSTLEGHLLTGEERVSVCWRENDSVDVEIVSFSRSAPSISGQIVWPFIGSMQKQFFLREMEHLLSVAKCE